MEFGGGVGSKAIKLKPGGSNWIIEGDIRDCFEGVKFVVLYRLIRRYVADKDFEILMRKFYLAGFIAKGYIEIVDGAVQERGVKSILVSVVLNELHVHTMEERKKIGGCHRCFLQNLRYVKSVRWDRRNKILEKRLRDCKQLGIPCSGRLVYSKTGDPLEYARYVDGFVIRVVGTQGSVIGKKNQIIQFLLETLGLKVCTSKIKIISVVGG